MKTRRILMILALLALSLAACDLFSRADPVAERIADSGTRALQPLGVAGPAFRFIITSDLHFSDGRPLPGNRISNFQALVNSQNPDFAVFVGDLADEGKPNDYALFRNFTDALTKAPAGGGGSLPWIAAVGNHDLYNNGWRSYRTQVGPSYYRVTVGNVSIYGLDSGNGTLGQAQLNRLQSDFAGDSRPKIVLCHYPIRGNDGYVYYRLTNPRERADLLDLFARNQVKAVFVGHWHYSFDTDCNLFHERIVGSFCNGTDGQGHCWVVDVDAAGQVSATHYTL